MLPSTLTVPIRRAPAGPLVLMPPVMSQPPLQLVVALKEEQVKTAQLRAQLVERLLGLDDVYCFDRVVRW